MLIGLCHADPIDNFFILFSSFYWQKDMRVMTPNVWHAASNILPEMKGKKILFK
jgi:hypothetical protein